MSVFLRTRLFLPEVPLELLLERRQPRMLSLMLIKPLPHGLNPRNHPAITPGITQNPGTSAVNPISSYFDCVRAWIFSRLIVRSEGDQTRTVDHGVRSVGN